MWVERMNSNKMQYRKGCGDDLLSVLGYGCMRFTGKGTRINGGKNRGIDLEKAEAELMAAIHGGVNYFDTAYIYTGSEVALGKIFKRNNCREQIYIATKLPQFMIRTAGGFDRHFDEQKKRLQTKYIDYYLIHFLNDVATWNRLERLGIKEWIAHKKQAGEIRHIGFSFHGNTEMFLKLLDVFDWDFCQIQYNYMDEFSQAGRDGLLAAHKKEMPVIVMEPLRGGNLVNMLPAGAREIIAADSHSWSPAEWAFRWLFNQPEVTCVLSGMNSMEMLHENMKAAAETMPGQWTSREYQVIEEVKNEIGRRIKVGCTGCGYCLPCPQGVDIPGSFRCYNVKYLENRKVAVKDYIKMTSSRKKPGSASQCNECGKCEPLCPQHIPIRKELKNVKRELETPFYKLSKLAFKLTNR
jgi:uncharacterized protein